MSIRYDFFTREPFAIPKIYSIGCSADTRATRYGPSRRNQYLIHYVISGRGIFNGTPLGRGEGFITTPGMLEHYYPDEGDPWRYLWIISYDSALEDYIEMHRPSQGGIFKFHNVDVVEEVERRLMADSDGFAFSNAEITEMYLKIFNGCVYSKSIADSKDTSAKLYLDYCVKYISANIHITTTVDELCKKLGVSQPYLYKVFRRGVGCSPKQYLSNARLAEAKRLLSETSLSVSDVATSVGYPSVLAFSKFFSKRTGMSPTEYRRSRVK